MTSHIGVGTTATSNTFDVRGTANVGALVTTSTHISDATTSTTKDTGALIITEGGVGIEENLNVGGDLKVDTSILVVNSTTNRWVVLVLLRVYTPPIQRLKVLQ